MSRYYSTQRPVMPGSYPKFGVEKIENFDDRRYVKEIDKMAWGYIDYSRDLSEKECEDYELIKQYETRDVLNKLFKRLVPDIGKAESVAGEIVRAVCRIEYRFYNDGDHLGIGSGKETCNPAGRYLAAICGDGVENAVENAWGIEDDEQYGDLLKKLEIAVIEFLKQNPELEEVENEKDMWDYADDIEDVDGFDEVEEY